MCFSRPKTIPPRSQLGINGTWACRWRAFGGAVLKWPDDPAEDKGLTVWHLADKESQWFSPSNSPFMINYRVDNLGEMIAQLRAGGVEIIGPESHENGKFAWIMDPDGNKVKLWGAEDLGRKQQNRLRANYHLVRPQPIHTA